MKTDEFPVEKPVQRSDFEEETDILSNVRVVLVEPQYSGNIGASARAMKNMGVTDLRLVFAGGRTDHLNAESRKMAMYAKDVLYRAPVCSSLGEAVSDCSIVIGTTRRKGKFRHATYNSRDIAGRVLETARQYPVALVFGPENVGLSNEHLRCCHELAFIPAHPDFGSLNLAMAVLIVCYEVFQGLRGASAQETAPSPLATAEDLAGLFGHMKDVLLEIGFLDPENPERMMTYLRRLLSRADLSPKDVRVLRGIFRQVRWAIGGEEFKGGEDGFELDEETDAPSFPLAQPNPDRRRDG
ncbi:MAG: RNA methyltransferase [Nitrospinota bacterium]